LCPFPHPAEFVEPAADGFCGHLNAVFGLERRGEGGTTPPRAAPAIGTWGFFEEGAERAREPGHQDGRLNRYGELTGMVDTYAQAPGTIRPHNTVHAGARAQQEGGNISRTAARRTQQQNVGRQEIAIPCAAEDRTHLALLCWRDRQ